MQFVSTPEYANLVGKMNTEFGEFNEAWLQEQEKTAYGEYVDGLYKSAPIKDPGGPPVKDDEYRIIDSRTIYDEGEPLTGEEIDALYNKGKKKRRKEK